MEGGVSIVQFREKGSATNRLEAARAIAEICRQQGVLFLVNDDPEFARAARADGVHVGRRDPTPATARAILGPGAIVGVTVYGGESEEEAAQEAGADYVAIGPFYPSPTKPEDQVAPLALPVFAIGGITAKNAGVLASYGVAGVAVVSAIMDAPDPRRAAEEILAAFRAGQRSPTKAG